MNKYFARIYLGSLLMMFVFFGMSALFSARAKESGDGFLRSVVAPFAESFGELEKVDEKFELESNFKEIEIKATTGSVEVKASTDGKVHLRFEGMAPIKEKSKFYGYKMQGGKLSIKADSGDDEFAQVSKFFVEINGESVASSMPSMNVFLEIPVDSMAELKVKTINGKIWVEGVNLHDFEAKTVDGTIEIRNAQFGETDLKTVGGAISIEETKAAEIHAGTVSGEILIHADTQRLELKSVSGHLIAGFPADRSLDFDWNTVSGKLTNDYVSKSATKNSPAIKGRFKTVSGDLKIQTLEKAKK